MKKTITLLTYILLPFLSYAADAKLPLTERPAEATVYFISPQNGEKVTSPVHVQFGLKGMGIAPAGVQFQNSGHHHLLINVEELPDLTTSLPATEQIKHFGMGQTEVKLDLPKGEHSLQLLLGDHLHRPHNPPVLSEKIRVTVE